MLIDLPPLGGNALDLKTLSFLRHIHDYIAQDSSLYAKRVTKALVDKNNVLDELPRLRRKVPELDEESVRELSLYSYRII